MDLGATICTPKKPACVLCPFTDGCTARARGDQEIFPRKAPKKSGAVRRGAAFVVTRGAEVLVRTRPAKGLLGGMTEVPTSDWIAGQDDAHARKQAPKLAVLRRGGASSASSRMCSRIFRWSLSSTRRRSRRERGRRTVRGGLPIATLKDEALPNVMRKVIAHALGL